MKHFEWKIKKEHHILKEFDSFLKEIEKIEEIQKIIPGRIARQQKGSSKLLVSFSYFTNSGLKYKIKKGSTAQELFIVCNKKDKESIYKKISEIIWDLII